MRGHRVSGEGTEGQFCHYQRLCSGYHRDMTEA